MILRLATRAMGTRFELVLIGDDEVRLRAAGEEALAEIEDCDRHLSLFRRDSMLSHVNRCAPLGWTRLDAELWKLLDQCNAVHRDSGGAFDPTIAPLMRAHGFRGAVSPGSDLELARQSVGWGNVELDRARCAVRFRNPGTSLDLGAIGKGHGIDRAASRLREAGVQAALLHGGTSTALAIGHPPGEACWRVAIGSWQRGPVASLTDCALSVSAGSGRTESGIGHVLNPRTGAPASGPCISAVIAGDATTADAWSTALLVDSDLTNSDLTNGDIDTMTAKGTHNAPRWNEAMPARCRFNSAPAIPRGSS